MLVKGKFDQARCPDCNSWHFALNLDDNNNIEEIKCCKCRKLTKYIPMVKGVPPK